MGCVVVKDGWSNIPGHILQEALSALEKDLPLAGIIVQEYIFDLQKLITKYEEDLGVVNE